MVLSRRSGGGGEPLSSAAMTSIPFRLRPMALWCLLLVGCLTSPASSEESPDTETGPTTAETHLDVHAAAAPNPPATDSVPEPAPATEAKVHPRELYDWSRAPYALGFNEDGAPYLRHPRCARGEKPHLGCRKRLTRDVVNRTNAIHLQVVRALGIEEVEPRLWRFLMTRSSTETSGNGSQRPLDNQGSVHRLDVAAAWRAGSRRAHVYEEAGNPLAERDAVTGRLPHARIWLGYGPQGQISWLFLDDWDKLGDPRMLADTVISDLTYTRVARRQLRQLTQGHIRCYEYDDDGRVMSTPWNGKRYRVGVHAVDGEKFNACVDAGPKKVSKRKRESEEQLERRCRLSNRVPYDWKPGGDQPANTIDIPYLDWWNLKRAIGGRPCPPWKGDEYEAHKRAKWADHARRSGFATEWKKRVRDRDLGVEPEGDQYDLWRSIWTAVVLELDGEALDWSSLEGFEVQTVPFEGPSKEKLTEQKLLERDPRALDRRFHKKSAGD